MYMAYTVMIGNSEESNDTTPNQDFSTRLAPKKQARRLRASAVEFVRGTGRQRVVTNAGPGRWPLALAGLFFAFLGAATIAGKMHPLLLAFYAAISITAFIAYALDKSAARDGRWRIAENTRCICWPCLAAGRARCWRNIACATNRPSLRS